MLGRAGTLQKYFVEGSESRETAVYVAGPALFQPILADMTEHSRSGS